MGSIVPKITPKEARLLSEKRSKLAKQSFFSKFFFDQNKKKKKCFLTILRLYWWRLHTEKFYVCMDVRSPASFLLRQHRLRCHFTFFLFSCLSFFDFREGRVISSFFFIGVKFLISRCEFRARTREGESYNNIETAAKRAAVLLPSN